MCIYNKLHLIKICLCCFLDMHLYSNKLSTITTISSLIISELLPPCFSCNNNFSLLHRSSGSEDKNIVFETPEAETIKPGDLSSFISVRSRVDLLPIFLHRNAFPFQNHTSIFYPLN